MSDINKPITLEDYKEVGPEFFDKFYYVKNQLPATTEVEDVLKIMETLAGLVMIKRDDEEESPTVGFLGNMSEAPAKEEKSDTYRMGF